MIRKLSDGRIINIAQRKSDPDTKVAFSLKNGKWIMSYTGNFDGLKKWLKHQKELAEKCEARKMIAEMCGTSCRAALEDMGVVRI
jgi:hypothetical protein